MAGLSTCFNGLTFVYNGKSSDMYGLYMGWRSANEEWSTGLDREIVKGEMNISRYTPNLYGVKYSDVLILEFDIFHQDGSAFTQRESRSINNWLMADSYKRFKVNDNNTDNVYYNAICSSIQDLTMNNFNGKHVVMMCDSPFAYTQEIMRTADASSQNITYKIINSGDAGVYHPLFTIECSASYTGTIEIKNVTDGNSMSISMKNISSVSGKKRLTVDTQSMMITDGNGALVPLYKIGWEIQTDENSAIQSSPFYWLRLVEGINELEIKGRAKVTFTLSFPRKAGQINEE